MTSYGKTDRTMGGIDWEAAEYDFVHNTGPRVSYREFADNAESKTWSGRQPIKYVTIVDYGKEHSWMRKRAEFMREKHSTLFGDAEIAYGFVINAIIVNGETMAPVDLARLSTELRNLQDLLMAHEVPDEQVDDRDLVTRDEVLSIIERYEPPSAEELLEQALGALGEEPHA